ncbi:MAG: DUF2235 domain-containing protein [Bradyrhizobium sp.]|uniref:phospholipase effector Tle1 domain-containing protein n=1 Tax=Bradyrhizobium sp. TaxID=376 RepID=UPI00345BBD76|nr:DUF2235 domain-containing protein [Bradyrhizobium sp.]
MRTAPTSSGWAGHPIQEKQDRRDEHRSLHFEQVWFLGVHADIGSGYLEKDARLHVADDIELT